MAVILIADDEENIRTVLREYAEFEGYDVLEACDGMEAVRIAKTNRVDLVIMDVMMPKLDGFSAVKEIRKEKDVPVIMLSARVEEYDKLFGFEIGADDYVTKPFDIDELLARIAVQLRIAASSQSSTVLSFRGVEMDTSSRGVTAGGVPVKLTKTEYAILKQLLLSPTRVITKSHILDMISEDTPDCVESSLKVHVSNLRRKLRDAGGQDYIESVWGIGFKMREE